MLQQNAPEWPWIVLGCISSGINGGTMPAFAIFFSEMIKVSTGTTLLNTIPYSPYPLPLS